MLDKMMVLIVRLLYTAPAGTRLQMPLLLNYGFALLLFFVVVGTPMLLFMARPSLRRRF